MGRDPQPKPRPGVLHCVGATCGRCDSGVHIGGLSYSLLISFSAELRRLVTMISLLLPIKFVDSLLKTDGYLNRRGGDKYIDLSALIKDSRTQSVGK